MKNEIKTDVCVIGGGSGGLSFAAGAVQMGARVVLLEGHKMGGDCLNYGCVPSKALIAAAKHAHEMTTGMPFGVGTSIPEVDYATVMEHVADVIRGIEPHDSVERFQGLGVNVITKYGRFISPREVAAGDHRIRARRFVIATGSSPLVPPIPGLSETPHLTNETIFSNREKPEHLIVIGAGPIGLELAQAHRRLGCRVTVLEGLVALGNDDPELTSTVIDRIRAEGVELHEGTFVSEVEGTEGDIRIKSADGTEYEGTHLLVAVGRKPNTARLDLDKAGIGMSGNAVQVDASLRTSNKRAYAIGDVAGGYQFTHVAAYHAASSSGPPCSACGHEPASTTFRGRPIPIRNSPMSVSARLPRQNGWGRESRLSGFRTRTMIVPGRNAQPTAWSRSWFTAGGLSEHPSLEDRQVN